MRELISTTKKRTAGRKKATKENRARVGNDENQQCQKHKDAGGGGGWRVWQVGGGGLVFQIYGVGSGSVRNIQQ